MDLPPICQVCGGEDCSRLDRKVNVSQACPACGAIGLHMCEVSPWRSLKDDRPPIHSYVLVRGHIDQLHRERCTLTFVRGGLGYYGELIGISVHRLIVAGFTEWMAVPE